MKPSIRYFLINFILLFAFLSIGQETDEVSEKEITWYSFEWLGVDDYGNLENPRGMMRFKPIVEGIPGMKGFQVSLDIQHSYIYESSFEEIIWRKPNLENKVINLQAAGRTRTKVLEDAVISTGSGILGNVDLRVIDGYNEPDDAEVTGFIGYDFFISMGGVLIIDHPGSRFAYTVDFPVEWSEHAYMVDMDQGHNYTDITVKANDRRVSLSFDPSPKPALILFRNWDFRRIASDHEAPDSLIYYPPRSRQNIKLGGRMPAGDIYFGPYKLKTHNVYLMPERNRRRGGANGLITQPFFEEYIMILDYKNSKFGIIPPSFVDR